MLDQQEGESVTPKKTYNDKIFDLYLQNQLDVLVDCTIASHVRDELNK